MLLWIALASAQDLEARVGIRAQTYRPPMDADRALWVDVPVNHLAAWESPVRTYLVGKGVPADRLGAVSFGEDRPVDSAHNKAAWEMNRRVDFFIAERSD